MATLQNYNRTLSTLGRGRILAFAIISGLGAAALTFLAITRHSKPVHAALPTEILVVVAARAIPARTIVHRSFLSMQRFPVSQIPPDAVRASDEQEITGKVALATIAAGQPFARHMFVTPNAAMGLAYAVTPTFRAVTVALDPVSGVGGFLKPGDHVDILTTSDAGSGREVTRTVLQNVALLALGTQTALTGSPTASDASVPASNATVMVSPQDAQALVLAAARGKLQLTLRAPDDPTRAELPDLHSAAPAEAVSVPVKLPSVAPLPQVTPQAVLPAPLSPEITVVKGAEVKTIRVGQ